MKLAQIDRLAMRPLTGTWFRALRLKHWKTRLSTERAAPQLNVGGRPRSGSAASRSRRYQAQSRRRVA